MDQKTKDPMAAETAAEYRATIRETAEAERSNRSGQGRPRAAKSMRLAYFFWFLLGGFGLHRFYLGYPLSGAGMLVLALFNGMFWLLPLPAILGYGLGVALTVWWLADAFLIPGLAPDAPHY